MNKRLLSWLLASLLLPAPGAAAQQVKLKANLQVAVSDPFYGASLVRFKEEVERHSGGAISIEIVDEGRLYRDEQVVNAVSSGAVDIGVAGSNRFLSKVPAVGILDQPFLFNFEALVRAAATPGSEIRRLIDEAILAGTGVRVLWWQSLGNSVVYSRGRDVADPARIRGRRVAVTDSASAEFYARCGGKPSVLSIADLHDALEDGTVDMAMTSLDALEAHDLWKVADTITRLEHAPVEYFLIINDKTWQSLSGSDRAIMAEVAADVEGETRDVLLEFESGADMLASLKGMKTEDLTPDQVAEWRACSAEMLAGYMQRNGELAHRLMAAYGRLRTDPCCTAGPSPGAFTRR